MTADIPDVPPEGPCPRCGERIGSATVRTAIWLDDRLFVVEDIPAYLCGSCMEQFYDPDTTEALRRLTEERFASIEPTREIVVPVFSLKGRIVRAQALEDEPSVEY